MTNGTRSDRKVRRVVNLRFMIEKRFGESGIVVAYPQRDVRFDASRPLQVELTARAAPPVPGTG